MAVIFGPFATWDSDGGGFVDSCARMRIPASALSGPGALVRIKLRSSSVEGFKIDQLFADHKAAAGFAWAYAGNQVEYQFGGVSGVNIAANSVATSDWTAFAFDDTKDFIVGVNVSSDGAKDGPRKDNTIIGYTLYDKAASNEAGVTAPAGFGTTANKHFYVESIECASTDMIGQLLVRTVFSVDKVPGDALVW